MDSIVKIKTDFYHPDPALVNAQNWRQLAEQKKQRQTDLIPKAWRLDTSKYSHLQDVTSVPRKSGILSEEELEITEIDDVEELAKRISTGKYTSVSVVTAFSKRAAIAHQLTNCLTEILFDLGLKRARELDDYYAKNGKTVGPLHGVPISLKDQIGLKGVEITIGLGSFLGRIADSNAAVVEILLQAGAVFYVKTNIPQTLMAGDTDNHVFGRAHNPLNINLIPGGSSGGEGILVALKGSILGVGTDIGGSCRMPAGYCGVLTLKPTSRKIPYYGIISPAPGQDTILSVAGPLARSLSSIRAFYKMILDANPSLFDSNALPNPYDPAIDMKFSQKRLTIGVLRFDGVVRTLPPVTRTLNYTVARLKDSGHDVVEFDGSEFNELIALSFELFGADSGKSIMTTLGMVQEPLMDIIVGPDPQKEERPVSEVYKLFSRKIELQNAFLRKWNATVGQSGKSIDVLLSPLAPYTAPLPGKNFWVGYTILFNILDLPVTVFPVLKGDSKLDVLQSGIKGVNFADQRAIDGYDPQLADGMPVSLQLVGRRWQEEALLGATEAVLRSLKPKAAAL